MRESWKQWERELEAPQPVRVHLCECCGGEIYEGEEAYQTDDNTWYCIDCIHLEEVTVPEYDFMPRGEKDNGYF